VETKLSKNNDANELNYKNSYMRFPYGPFARGLGCIGINRLPKKEGEERPSMVQVMADLFKVHDDLVMLVTPEGTRSLCTKWKTGFAGVISLQPSAYSLQPTAFSLQPVSYT
jgi:1-acyl-sn-glycerol-3-phosphate acyltransferase